MSKTHIARILSILIIAGLLGGILPIPIYAGQAASILADKELRLTEKSSGQTAFLPIVNRRAPLMTTIFGVEMASISNPGGLEKVVHANMTWIRRNGLLWSEVEQTKGTYNWSRSHTQNLEGDLIRAAQNGFEVILIVRGTPGWAQKVAGYTCGPVKPENIPDFAAFMRKVVERYSNPPFNVKYYQFWNEPDVSYEFGFPPNYPFGCWGEINDPYFGGGYYGQVMKAIYPEMKAANAAAKLLIGGLLFICDPHSSACKELAPKFLEGILKEGVQDSFDGIAFHAYDHYQGELGQYGNMAWGSGWQNNGPVVVEKAEAIRKLLSAYGITGKELFNTEGALICGQTGTEPVCQTEDFELTKAYYIPQLYAMAIAEGLQGNIYYSVQGWRNSQLVDGNLDPLPGYHALRFSRAKLADAKFVSKITAYPNVNGYELERTSQRFWVVWSRSGGPQTITLPGTPLAIFDSLGKQIPVTGSTLTVGVNTLYVEWPK
jgi:hypothetical protein